MSQLHKALECLRPKDFSQVPRDDLNVFLSDIFANAELIANSVPPPPNGTPYESSCRSRPDANGAKSAAELTVSKVRRPAVHPDHEALHQSWGKPLKLSAKDNASGIVVYKMAGNDRHGAWFARSSVHEGLGFAKWKRAMMREFPESLAVQGGPGEGNVRGIGGDRRLEDVHVEGVGKMEVFQLSAQFPGPVSPREFITLLLTSENALSDASKVGNAIPRHYMVVSIPVTHPDAPPREGLIRGYYESVELIREIPLPSAKSASTSDLPSAISFTESPGPEAKGEKIDRNSDAHDDDPETNPVEWLMITRSDPGGGIPRFMVERNTPSSIVQDAGKFLDWACKKDDFPSQEEDERIAEGSEQSDAQGERAFSMSEANGYLAGIGTSIADNTRPSSIRRLSQRSVDKSEPGVLQTVANTVESYIPDSLNPLQRTQSHESSTSESSLDSWASAEQFNTAPEPMPEDGTLPTPSTTSETSIPISAGITTHPADNPLNRELQKIEDRRQQLKDKLQEARDKQGKETHDASLRSAKELEKATERHNRERKKQEEKYTKEIQKLEQRRERETKKLLARQQREAAKDRLTKTQHERDEWKERAQLTEDENRILKEQIGELQRENTALVAIMGKSENGRGMLKKIQEELDGKGRKRANSRGSASSRGSSGKKGEHHQFEHSHLNLASGG